MKDSATALRDDGVTVVRRAVPEATAEAWARALAADAEQTHAHSELMWRVRMHAGVRAAFAAIWHVPAGELLASFEGAAWRGEEDAPWSLPWHVDQDGGHADGLVSVQGLLALTHVNHDTGGTCFLTGSHVLHKSIVEPHAPTETWDFVPVNRRHCGALRAWQPRLHPGDMLLWDSRTVHRVKPPKKCSVRGVVYVSMAPAASVSPAVRARRRAAFRDGVSTTHWVTKFVDRGEPRREPSVRWCKARRLI